MTNRTAERSPLFYARLAGFLYLLLFVIAPFSLLYVPSAIIVPGDAAATAANIASSELVFRFGIIGESLIVLTELALIVVLYVLLKPVSRMMSMMAAFSRLGMAVIHGVNLLGGLFALQLLSGADFLKGFTPDQLNALGLVLLEGHDSGVFVAQVFFAFHLFFLGYLVFRSGYFPRLLGILLVLSSVGYLTESYGNFLAPGYESVYASIVMVLAMIGELPFMLWLLIKGISVSKWNERVTESPF
jgi:hypothetical protein